MTEKTAFRHLKVCVKRHSSIHTGFPAEPRTTERQNYFKNRTFMAALFILLIGLSGCSNKASCRYDTPEAALEDYASLLDKVGKRKKVPTSDLIVLTKEWHTTGDSVLKCIDRDVSDTVNNRSIRFAILNDSITVAMEKLVDSRHRTFKDYLSVLSALNEVEKDSVSQVMITAVHRFYTKAGEVPVFAGDNKTIVRRYEHILDNALDEGFKSKQDVIRFLHDEDVAYRSFLDHLSTIGNLSLEGISSKSKLLTTRMFNLASGHSPMFQKAEIVLILTIRQNRRIIQNAYRCLEDLRIRKLADSSQQTAYLWMILQPWIILDEFSYSLLDKEQLRLLETIAGETGDALKKLPGSRFPIDVDALPSTLIKSRIAYPEESI